MAQSPPEFEVNTEWVRCPVCDRDEARLYRDRMYHMAGADFRLVRCRCGMVYVNPRPDGPTIGSMYDDASYYAEGYSLGVEEQNYFERRDELLAQYDGVVQEMERETGGQGTLFELGSAGGFLLEAARRRGFTVLGTELSPTAVAYSRDELGLNVFQGELEDAPYEEGSLDVAIADNVLEHQLSPGAVLQNLFRLLRPGGHLVVIVPSYVNSKYFRLLMRLERVIPREFFGKRLLHILKFDPDRERGYPYHILEFDRKTVIRLIEASGFEVVSFQRSVPLPAHLFKVESPSKRIRVLRGIFSLLDKLMRAGLAPGARVRVLARRPS